MGRPRLDVDMDMVETRYRGGESQTAIAAALGVSQSVVSRVLRERKVPANPHSPHRHADGKGNNWKGGRTVNPNGYVLVWMSVDHPWAPEMRNRVGYALEHRLVVAERIGRPLTKDETVHHIDGDPSNNDPSNLELRVGRHGKGATGSHCPTCSCFPKAED